MGIHQSDQVAALIDELIVQCPDSPLQNGRIEIHNDIQDIPRVVQISLNVYLYVLYIRCFME